MEGYGCMFCIFIGRRLKPSLGVAFPTACHHSSGWWSGSSSKSGKSTLSPTESPTISPTESPTLVRLRMKLIRLGYGLIEAHSFGLLYPSFPPQSPTYCGKSSKSWSGTSKSCKTGSWWSREAPETASRDGVRDRKLTGRKGRRQINKVVKKMET
jgi:hypothetical protein